MSIGARIRQMREARMLTQGELGDHLGLKRASVSAIELGKSELTLDHLLKLSIYFGVGAEELLHGHAAPAKIQERLMPVVVDRADNPVVKLLPEAVQAGYLEDRADPQFWNGLPEIALPDRKYRQGQYIGVQVVGESMQYTLNGGDYVLCRYVDNPERITYGDIYVVAAQGFAPVVKRIEPGAGDDVWRLVSDNSSYRPYELPRAEVVEVWRYETLVRTQPFTLRKGPGGEMI